MGLVFTRSNSFDKDWLELSVDPLVLPVQKFVMILVCVYSVSRCHVEECDLSLAITHLSGQTVPCC